MSDQKALNQVTAAISNQLGTDAGEIKLESRLIEDLHADSMDIIAMVMELEQEIGMEIPEDEMGNIHTVGDIVNFIERHA